MVEMSEIHKGMTEFYRRRVAELPVVPSAKPFEVRIDEQRTESVPFPDEQTTTKKATVDQQVLGPPRPQIKSCNPDSGKLAGFSPCDILAVPGTNSFLSTAEVYFDDIPATGVVWNNPEFISCLTPPHDVAYDPGVTVRIRNVPGIPESDGEKEDAFDYFGAPYITSITVSPTGVFIITGGNFYFATGYKVTFSGINATDVQKVDFHTLHVVPPPGISGGDIVVINPDFERQRSNTVTYVTPPDFYTINGPDSVLSGVWNTYTVQARLNAQNHPGGYNAQILIDLNWARVDCTAELSANPISIVNSVGTVDLRLTKTAAVGTFGFRGTEVGRSTVAQKATIIGVS